MVEKEIFRNIPYVFRKLYLFCKTLALEWKQKYNFHSYVLKTVFLWTCEKKWHKKKVFTEDDILPMIVDIFGYLQKCYEERNIPLYFIPDLNLLEEYSKTKEEKLLTNLQGHVKQVHSVKLKAEDKLFNQTNLISEIRKFASLESLAKIIRERFICPFAPIVQSEKSTAILTRIYGRCSENMSNREQPSHQNLYVLYNEKIKNSSGILKDEDKLELLCELYVTFLFFLHEGMLGSNEHIDYGYLQHSLYFLKIFENTGNITDAADCINDVKNAIDSTDDNIIAFIMEYSESIIEIFNPLKSKDYSRSISYFLPKKDAMINLDKCKRLREEYKTNKLSEIRRNGNLDHLDDQYLSLIYGRNIDRYVGNSAQSQDLQKLIEKKKFGKMI